MRWILTLGCVKSASPKTSAGKPRILLNNQPVFMLGPLDQGYWPDGLYTPPTEAAMLYDLQVTKQLGFNMVRKHVKVEPQRWYAACDRLGLIVWQDMPNGGKPVGEKTSALAMHFGLQRDDSHERMPKAGRAEQANRKKLQGRFARNDGTSAQPSQHRRVGTVQRRLGTI